MRNKIIGIISLIIGIIIILKIPVGRSIGFLSPDHKYGVYGKAYLWTYLFPMSPGDGNSKPGKVYLYDTLTNEIIADGEIDFISNIKDIEWTENSAYFPREKKPNSTEPWILPVKIKMPYNKIIENKNLQTVYEYNSFDKLISVRKDTIVNNKRVSIEYKSFDENGKIDFKWKVYKIINNLSYATQSDYKNGRIESKKNLIWNNE